MRWFSSLVALVLLTVPLHGADVLAGWTVPSLSQLGVNMVIRLLADGTATEEIGTFQGRGKWTREGDGYLIGWESRWTGRLQHRADGKWELSTWKPDADRNGPPSDCQVATPLAKAAER
jgi:hypothetical protein